MQSTGLQELEQTPGVDVWQPQIRRIWGWFLSQPRNLLKKCHSEAKPNLSLRENLNLRDTIHSAGRLTAEMRATKYERPATLKLLPRIQKQPK